MSAHTTNVVFAGLGGQGIVKASDILAEAAFLHGFDVKKSELHGMSQRGGSVSSDVRFGYRVLSPMIPEGEADYLVLLDATQLERARRRLSPSGTIIAPDSVDVSRLTDRRSLNVALLGALSRCLDVDERHWLQALRANLPQRLHDVNEHAFRLGRGEV